MHAGHPVDIDAEQQRCPMVLIHQGIRRFGVAVGVPSPGRDTQGAGTCHHIRPSPEGIGDDAHAAGQVRTIRIDLHFACQTVGPVFVCQIHNLRYGVRRHHDRPFWADDMHERIDNGVRAALNKPETAQRTVHLDTSAGGQAQSAQPLLDVSTGQRNNSFLCHAIPPLY